MDSEPIRTIDGLELESRWDFPDGDPVLHLVFCHPHPLHGGTMTAPLMQKVTDRLVAAGIAVLRFNFRGVGTSEGGWDGGIGELDDVDAAMTNARMLAGPVGLAGWSFGAAAGLRWQAREDDDSIYIGIAPPVTGSDGNTLPQPHELAEARRTIVIGERDQLISVDESRSYADQIGADFLVLPASDHFFHFREDRVADVVLSGLFYA